MEARPDQRPTPSKPRDHSLEAYKAWITAIAERLTTDKANLKFTEEEWIRNWKEYWRQKPLA